MSNDYWYKFLCHKCHTKFEAPYSKQLCPECDTSSEVHFEEPLYYVEPLNKYVAAERIEEGALVYVDNGKIFNIIEEKCGCRR